jgi:hypothetical protein
MFWAVVSWGFGVLARVCRGFLGPTPRLSGALWRDRYLFAGPMSWARRAGSGTVCGQFTAERVKTRMAAVVMRIAQPARTSRLRAASVVVLASPQMSCSPAPVWSSTP